MEFATIATGSSGNCNLIRTDKTNLIVDMGIPWNKTQNGLNHFNVGNVDAFFVTHEHIDHIGGLEVVSKRIDAPIYMTQGTIQGTRERRGETDIDLLAINRGIKVGDISVTPINTYHDVYEPCGYMFENGNERLTLITDTGMIDDNIRNIISDSDAVMLEADYEDEILKDNSYAPALKERISSNFGHLSNDTSADILAKALDNKRLKKAILIHGSKNSNTPLCAYRKVRDEIMKKGYLIDIDLMLSVADREKPSNIITVKEA